MRRRRAAAASKTRQATAMSSTNGILTVLRAWNGLCGPDEVLSVGVLCSGKDATQLKVWKKTNPNLDYLSYFPCLFCRLLRSSRRRRALSPGHLRRREMVRARRRERGRRAEGETLACRGRDQAGA